MTKEELAKRLDQMQYPCREMENFVDVAINNNLVIVFALSDDLMEFRGRIDDEFGAYEGGIAYLDKWGLIQNKCDDPDCPYFEKEKNSAVKIKQIWHNDGPYCWTYEPDIEHAIFEILESDIEPTKYCLAIVFSMKDLEKAWEAQND